MISSRPSTKANRRARTSGLMARRQPCSSSEAVTAAIPTSTSPNPSSIASKRSAPRSAAMRTEVSRITPTAEPVVASRRRSPRDPGRSGRLRPDGVAGVWPTAGPRSGRSDRLARGLLQGERRGTGQSLPEPPGTWEGHVRRPTGSGPGRGGWEAGGSGVHLPCVTHSNTFVLPVQGGDPSRLRYAVPRPAIAVSAAASRAVSSGVL